MIDPDALYEQQHIAEYLGKTKTWMERARSRGIGPVYLRLGRSIRYRGSDILTWLDGQRHTSLKKAP